MSDSIIHVMDVAATRGTLELGTMTDNAIEWLCIFDMISVALTGHPSETDSIAEYSLPHLDANLVILSTYFVSNHQVEFSSQRVPSLHEPMSTMRTQSFVCIIVVPTHGAPPFNGAGFVHERVRRRPLRKRPPGQPQSDHALQGLQAPSTESVVIPYNIDN